MPDGYSVDLEQFTGLSAAGETALRDQVNNHYWRTFGASLAIGAIGGLANLGSAGAGTWDAYRAGVGASAAQSASHILDRFLNTLPTITIREGHRVKIYLTQDLQLPAYDDHHMPADL
jgi:type IV secretion system protein VirB10